MLRCLLPLALAGVAAARDPDPRALAIESYLAALTADGEEEPFTLEKTVVTATREEERALELPYTTDRVDEKTIEQRSYRSTPQLLRNTPGVLVQETSPGQGSPYIRGFTGFRTLFLIDGIRLNNSTFREGPNQYWATVDPLSMGRYELVKGPSSVLYGSDAIGGTLNAFTRDPYGYGTGWTAKGLLYARFASAEESQAGRVEASIGRDGKTGLLAGFTGRNYGDAIAGQPIGTQPNTAYDLWAADAKVEHFLGEHARVVFAYQQVEMNNVPRTHRTIYAKSFHGTTIGTDLRHDFDQERLLLYTQLHAEEIEGVVDEVHASLSWHEQDEVRDRIRSGDRRDKQGVDVGTFGAWVQCGSDAGIARLTYGLEYYHDNVNSFSTGNAVQGPVADDATYDLLGAYLQALVAAGPRWEVILGIRFTWAAADADRVFDPVTSGATSISDDWTAITGSVRVLYRLEPDRWHLFGGVSQGFRAPNLADLTRLDSARSGDFEIPAPGLDPEDFVAFELGAKGSGKRFAIQLSGYYTLILDQITRFPTGATTPDGETIVSKANAGDGWVWGVELEGSCRFLAEWTLFGSVTYMEGKVDTFTSPAQVASREYLTRLMPLTAQVGVRWDEPQGRFWVEVYVLMADRADKLSPGDLGDTQRIPPGGTPGYGVVNLLGGWNVSERASLVAGVENLFDKSYRVHGSGSNMPGLNFLASFRLNF